MSNSNSPKGASLPSLAAVAFATAVGGCANFDQMDGANTRTENRPENTGIAQYASEACRRAEVEVVPYGDYYRNRGYYSRQRYSAFNRAFGGNRTFQNAYTVTSQNGQPYVLVSDRTESSLFQLAGLVAGVAIAAPNSRGGHRYRNNNVSDAAKTVAGAVIGAVAGGIASDAVNIRARESFDRCRYDVQMGAYDVYRDENRYRQPNPAESRFGFSR